MKQQLTKRIFFACITVFLLSFGLVMYVMNTYLAQRNLEELKDNAVYIASVMNAEGWAFLDDMPAENSIERITVITQDGTVLYDSMLDPSQMENHKSREEIGEALRTGEGFSERYSESLLQKTENYAISLHDGNIVRVSMTQDTIWLLLYQMLKPMIAIVLVMILLSVILASRSSEAITKPINQLDPENPDDTNIYPEMKPFVQRLMAQNQQIHSQMTQIKQEHKKQDTMRREFTANVSHEFKTPLTSISGFAEIIRDGYVQEKDISHFADTIYTEAQRLIVLVNDILKLSYLEEGNIDQKARVPVELSALCRSIQERLAMAAEKQQVSLLCEGEMVTIIGIPQTLEEIIYNLCDNAIKYNHTGGFVQISIRKQEQEAMIQVLDNGIGIPEADQQRVFERFYRVNKSHSKEVGGTGLGLSIVKHGMALHNGEITLESHENQGTCIQLHFPLSESE